MSVPTMPRSKPPPPGVYVPLSNFFSSTGEIDYAANQTHALRLAKSGVVGMIVQGSRGEAVNLDREERKRMVRSIREVLGHHGYTAMPLIVGIGAPSLHDTARLCKDAKEAGGDYALVLPPSYSPATTTTYILVDYFTTIAKQSPIPIIIYNFPSVTNGVNVDSDTMIELAKHPNIVGCKMNCGNLGNIQRICTHTKQDEFVCLPGKAEFALQALVSGSPGCMAAQANLAPKTLAALYKAWTEGNLAQAQLLQRLISDADLAQTKLGASTLRLAVSEYWGYGSGKARSPLPDGDPAKLKEQKGLLDELIAYERTL